jgi:hypothetical protein
VRGAREAEKVLANADAADVTERLRVRESQARRHTLWALLGVSPIGLIPLVATTSEFGVAALAGGMLVITVREALRAMSAHSEVSELREELHRLTSK